MDKSKTKQQLLLEIDELRTRLEEAEETLRAIRSGEVDALVVSGPQGDQIYTLQGADQPYRILFETIEEGAATLSIAGTILYCNRRLATMLKVPLEKVIGSSFENYLSPEDWQIFQKINRKGIAGTNRWEVKIKTADGGLRPTLVSLGHMEVGDTQGICMTATDLTEQKRVEEALQRSQRELHILSSRLLTIQEDERRRIALELHDSIAQNLVAMRMFLIMNLGAVAGSPPPGVSLKRIYSMLGDCIVELRRMIDDLRPSVLEELGVIIAVKGYCAKFESLNSGIRVEQEITALERDIPKELQMVVYRILQEALNNVHRHSQAKIVRVFLRKKEDRIELGIEDDGAGFDVENTQSQGLERGIGLSSMKERALLSEGSISIQSAKGKGTTVAVSWPC